MNGVRQLLACRLPLLSVRPTLPRVFIRATRNLPSIVSANEYYFCFFSVNEFPDLRKRKRERERIELNYCCLTAKRCYLVYSGRV